MWFKKIRTFFNDTENIAIIMMCIWILTGVLVIPSSLLAAFGIISVKLFLRIVYMLIGMFVGVGILTVIFLH